MWSVSKWSRPGCGPPSVWRCPRPTSLTGGLLGTVLAVFRVSPIPPLRVAGAVYVEVLRNMPLRSLLVLFVFGLPDIGLTFSLFTSRPSAWTRSVRRSSARRCAAGSNAVPVGGALDLGRRRRDRIAGALRRVRARWAGADPALHRPRRLSRARAVRWVSAAYIELFRGLVVPTLVTGLVALLKDSAHGYVVSYPELTCA